jgi:hypothetical protein
MRSPSILAFWFLAVALPGATAHCASHVAGTCSYPGQTAADGEKAVGKNRLWRPERHRPPFSHGLRGPVASSTALRRRTAKNSIESVDASELYAASRQLYR